MADIWLLGTDHNLPDPQIGWFPDQAAAAAERERACEQAHRDADAAASNAVRNDRDKLDAMAEERRILAAAGITDPTVPDPTMWARPRKRFYQPMTVTFPHAVIGVRPGTDHAALPADGTVWLLAWFTDPCPQVLAGCGWYPDLATAEAEADRRNHATRADYDEAVANTTKLQDTARRTIRDHHILTSAGRTPTFTLPEVPDNLPGYDQWRDELLDVLGDGRMRPIAIHRH